MPTLSGTFSLNPSHADLGDMADFAWDAADDASTLPYQLPDNLTTFIIIPSAADSVAGRDQLRGSWLRTIRWLPPVLNRPAPAFGSPQSTRQHAWDYGFFVGGGEKSGVSAVGQMGPRSSGQVSPRMLGDIVRLAAPDGYERLGEKMLAALAWASAHVRAKFFLKVDEDTWVHPGRLIAWLARFAALEVSPHKFKPPHVIPFHFGFASHLCVSCHHRLCRLFHPCGISVAPRRWCCPSM